MEQCKKEICTKRCIFSKSADCDFDYQENLLSYNDDLLKVVRCCVNNFIVNTAFQNSQITVYGKTKITLTYISESSGCISCAEFEEDFEKSFQTDISDDDLFIEANITDKYSNWRVINQRRIDIHNSFAVSVCTYAPCKTDMADSADDVMIDKQKVDYISRVGFAYVKAEFEDEAAVTDGAAIQKIINVFADAHCSETKIIADKMLVKTSLRFSVLYTADSDKQNDVRRCEKTIEISTIVDINGIAEGDAALVYAKTGNIFFKTKTDKNNELTVIDLAGDVNLSCCVYRKYSEYLSDDAYSVNHDVKNFFTPLELDVDYSLVKESYSSAVKFEFESVDISEILDLDVSLSGDKTIELSAFVINKKGEIVFVSDKKQIEFAEYQKCSAYISSYDYVIKSDNVIELRTAIAYTALSYKPRNFNLLSEVELKSGNEYDSPALAVYFADKNERLWDIAKCFRTSVELIKKENELTDDILDTKRILLIPGM